MMVLKFGGSSVGTPDSILSVKRIVESQPEPVIVVVSALGGITDRLIATSQMALQGDEAWKDEFDAMQQRHHDMVNTIIPILSERTALLSTLDELFEILNDSIQDAIDEDDGSGDE